MITSALIVVAHPDDEVLGFGASGAAIANSGAVVRACILSAEVGARANRPGTAELREDTLRAQEVLGFGSPILGRFPNVAMNGVPHLELVQFIEGAILESGATTIFTHHPRDLNNDHLHVSLACQAAAQLWRRREGVAALQSLLLMETLSSTDWSTADGRAPFEPNMFIPVAENWIDKKIEALSCYRGVMRPRPHSRSREAIRALATFRGSQCGHPWAEAFQAVFGIISTGQD